MKKILITGSNSYIGTNVEKWLLKDKEKYAPINAYGQSKLEADLKIQELNDETFKTVVIRTPVVYGPGAKGNFPRLQKLALKLPIISNIKNQRSMIYIDNLSNYIKNVIDNDKSGVFYPQNEDYMSTYEIMKATKEANGKKVRSTRLFNWVIKLLSFVIPTVNKVYGNKTYELDKNYKALVTNKESIEKSYE